MFEQIPDMPGEEFNSVESYIDQFWKDCEGIDLLWKLECRQTFREPGVPSWEAWDRGEREESMRLAEEMRPGIREKHATQPFVSKRVRIVQYPLSEYLEWELELLRIRAEEGDDIRIVDVSHESQSSLLSLPEVVGLGNGVLWHVLYSDRGELVGGRKLSDTQTVDACRSEFQGLFEQGMAVGSLFASGDGPSNGDPGSTPTGGQRRITM